MTARQESAASTLAANPFLTTALQMAVPLEIERLRGLPDRVLEGHRTLADLTVQNSDAMQFGGKGAGPAFAAHVRAFALLALLAEGGIDFCGLHWCGIPGCRAASRFEHVPDIDDAETPEVLEVLDVPGPRAIHDVPIAGAWL